MIGDSDPPGYELIEEVGEGGMGVVYRARDTRLNRVVALKMVLHNADRRASIRFLAEAEAVAAINHPEVRKVLIAQGNDVIGNTSAEFAKVIKADSEKWGGIGRKLGITLD